MTERLTPFYDLVGIDAVARRLKIDPQHVRRARTAFFKHALGPDAALAAIPAESRGAFAAATGFRALALDRRVESAVDHASKLILRTAAGFSIEAVVLRPATGRVALCVSSQVGCAAACAFCATGHMGVARNLAPEEILDQLALANEALAPDGRRVRNIVFMGMGEPLHNEANLLRTLAVLQSPAAFDHPPSRTLVSTVGEPDAMRRVAAAFPTTNFALSLHAARQDVREAIVPLARKHHVDALRTAVADLNTLQPAKSTVLVEHVMLAAVNDTGADADALVEWSRGLRVHINLIPFNQIADAPHLTASPREAIERFGARLKAAGFPTTIRYSLGSDIAAACGQLVREENREVVRSQHAR